MIRHKWKMSEIKSGDGVVRILWTCKRCGFQSIHISGKKPGYQADSCEKVLIAKIHNA